MWSTVLALFVLGSRRASCRWSNYWRWRSRALLLFLGGRFSVFGEEVTVIPGVVWIGSIIILPLLLCSINWLIFTRRRVRSGGLELGVLRSKSLGAFVCRCRAKVEGEFGGDLVKNEGLCLRVEDKNTSLGGLVASRVVVRVLSSSVYNLEVACVWPRFIRCDGSFIGVFKLRSMVD